MASRHRPGRDADQPRSGRNRARVQQRPKPSSNPIAYDSGADRTRHGEPDSRRNLTVVDETHPHEAIAHASTSLERSERAPTSKRSETRGHPNARCGRAARPTGECGRGDAAPEAPPVQPWWPYAHESRAVGPASGCWAERCASSSSSSRTARTRGPAHRWARPAELGHELVGRRGPMNRYHARAPTRSSTTSAETRRPEDVPPSRRRPSTRSAGQAQHSRPHDPLTP